jgi:hypothetical protein
MITNLSDTLRYIEDHYIGIDELAALSTAKQPRELHTHRFRSNAFWKV